MPPHDPKNPDRQIPLLEPCLQGNEAKYVQECLSTNWVSYVGPFVDRFESELATKTDCLHAVATNSGTAALHIALLLAGVTPDAEVLMPGMSFVAPANAVRYCGAWPTCIDVQSSDWQFDVDKLQSFLQRECLRRDGAWYNRHTSRRIAAILPVHLLGGMCDVDAIASIANEYELPTVEDAAECLGATFRSRRIGAPATPQPSSIRIVVTSFNGNKIATTGGGGALLFNDDHLARRAAHLTTTAKTDAIEFFHDEVGYNYRLSNVAAAIGVGQLEMLSELTSAKRAIAERYQSELAAEPVVLHPEPVDCTSTFWLYTILVNGSSRPVIRHLIDHGVSTRPLWTPIHQLPAFANHCYVYHCDVSDDLHTRALSLPSSVGLSRADQDEVITKVRSAVSSQDGGD